MDDAQQNFYLDILLKVNEFYDSAWVKLLVCASIGGAIVGIVIPYFIQLSQQREFKIKEENLEKRLIASIEAKIDAIKKDVENKVSKQVEIAEKKVTAGLFHLQGNESARNKYYSLACKDFVCAGELYVETDNLTNGNKVLKSLHAKCLPRMTKEDFKKNRHLENDIKDLLALLFSKNNDGKFSATIDSIEDELEKSLKRSKQNGDEK